jgi:hypothetical protein
MANRTNGPAMPLMSHPPRLCKLTATRGQMMKKSNRNLYERGRNKILVEKDTRSSYRVVHLSMIRGSLQVRALLGP